MAGGEYLYNLKIVKTFLLKTFRVSNSLVTWYMYPAYLRDKINSPVSNSQCSYKSEVRKNWTHQLSDCILNKEAVDITSNKAFKEQANNVAYAV